MTEINIFLGSRYWQGFESFSRKSQTPVFAELLKCF